MLGSGNVAFTSKLTNHCVYVGPFCLCCVDYHELMSLFLVGLWEFG